MVSPGATSRSTVEARSGIPMPNVETILAQQDAVFYFSHRAEYPVLDRFLLSGKSK